MEEKDLRELSDQLMNPTGEKGIEVANMMNETNKGMTFNSIDNLALKGGEIILEIGHGNAGHLEYLLDQAAGITYEGVDISELMISEAIRINSSLIKSEKVSFTHYNGTDIPFQDESFDAVFTVNTIYFWKKPLEFLKEIERVMKQGAIFTLTFAEASFMEQLPFTRFNFTLYNIDTVVGLVEQSGLNIEKTDVQKEHVRTKTGELVEREFLTVSLRK